MSERKKLILDNNALQVACVVSPVFHSVAWFFLFFLNSLLIHRNSNFT